MPPFALWTWPSATIGTMDELLTRIKLIESSISFRQKIDRAVWRGTPSFNPIDNIRLRPNLIAITRDKEWANVQALKKPTGGAKESTGIPIHDLCRYKYIIYTDGITYSGRLPYHQACASVILTPPLIHHSWTTQLLKPLFSSSLDLDVRNMSKYQANWKPWAKDRSTPDERWPKSYPPDEANVIFLAPDWSDLEAVVQWLRDHEDVAEKIASNGRKEVVGGGYLSPAAEACYWRALIRGWGSVAKVEIGDEEGQWAKDDGTRWEEWVATDMLHG